jgi:hypothetical protein
LEALFVGLPGLECSRVARAPNVPKFEDHEANNLNFAIPHSTLQSTLLKSHHANA